MAKDDVTLMSLLRKPSKTINNCVNLLSLAEGKIKKRKKKNDK